MLLQLILGIAGTGKTTQVLGALEARARQGGASVLLVPEQFSSSAEAMVYRRLGDLLSARVEVLSFRTLAERILRSGGGLNTPVLGDAGRTVFVRRALDAVGSSLRVFARQKRSAAFCNLCAQTLAELKTAGATPAVLRGIAQEKKDAKLEEIALIFDAYEGVIDGAALDPEDRLTLAAGRAGEGWFDGKHCYIDGFDGFTAPEYTMLEQILRHCAALTVTLCCPSLDEGGQLPGLFTPVRRAAHRLMRLAGRAGAQVQKPVVLWQVRRTASSALAALNHTLAQGEPEHADAGGDITLTPAADEWQEVALVAAEMRRLAQAGVPYRRMAVVCRELADYERVVRRQMEMYDIPVFIDASTTIEYTAPVIFIRAALALLRQGLVSRAILPLLKSGLCGWPEAQLAALENYVYTWEPKAADWRKPFENNPEGLLQRMDDAAQEQLEMAEAVRGKTVPALSKFIQDARQAGAAELSRRLYLLMDKFGAVAHCEEMARRLEAGGDAEYAGQLRRAWDLSMDLLDQMAALLGGEVLTAEEYEELFLLLVRSTDFGQTPQTLECATLTSADRMRLDEVEYCFVVGVNEGDFPRRVGYSGLLNHLDRDALVAGGVEMPGSFENRTLLEEMFFYRALTAPEKTLYISWPARRGAEAKAPSVALGPVLATLNPAPLQADLYGLAPTPAAAYDLLARSYRENTPQAAALYQALAQAGDTAHGALSLLDAVDNPGQFSVREKGAIQRLVGKNMRLSATVAERFYQCRFSYYMERVLRVAPRRRAELSPLESGTLVHHTLEKVIGEMGAGFAACTNAQLEEMVARHAGEFVAQQLPDDTRRGAWRLGQITQATVRLLIFLRDVAQQSAFSINALELEIGDAERGVPALALQAANGGRLEVTGKVDRVDIYREGDKTYLCIIDYKTGNKKFSLEEVYCGINMQMIIYMDAICDKNSERYPNPTPAAVLYLTGDPSPVSGGRKGQEGTTFKFDGLLLEDGGILRALGAGTPGAFPVRFNKDGALRAGSRAAPGEVFENMRTHVRKMLEEMTEAVEAGGFPARPLVKGERRPCDYCPYRAACRHEDGLNEVQMAAPEDAFMPRNTALPQEEETP